MNCLQFRRAMETDPNQVGDAERAHARQCAACAEHVSRIARFNRKLDVALDVTVPENLSDKLLLRHAFRPRKVRRLHWPALAAGLTLLVSGALAVLGYLHNESQLEHEVIALVDAADYALQARGPVAAQTLSSTLEPVGLQIDGVIGSVSFVGRCLVRGNLSGHVVLRDQNAPITVFLMPAEKLIRQTSFEDGNWSGLLVPVDNGAIAIVAPHGQVVDDVMRRLLDAVRWPV